MDLLKIFHDLIHKPKPGGWVIDKVDERDYKFVDYFGKDVFGAVIPTKFIWEKDKLPVFPFQDSALSCVSCSFTFVNSYHSKNDENDVLLSWRHLFASVPQFSGGTSFRDNAECLRKTGQCEDLLMPGSQYYHALNQAAEKKFINENQNVLDNAKSYKIKGYFQVRAYNKAELKTAVMKAPVIIGVYTNLSAWSKDVIVYDGFQQFGHAIVICGWDEKYWYIADWNGVKELRKMDINHPIASATVVADIPDDIPTLMLKTVKIEEDPKIWILFRNGKRQHITSWEQYQAGLEKKLWNAYVMVPKEELDLYPVDEKNPLAFLL
jgi:hypothetical protein